MSALASAVRALKCQSACPLPLVHTGIWYDKYEQGSPQAWGKQLLYSGGNKYWRQAGRTSSAPPATDRRVSAVVMLSYIMQYHTRCPPVPRCLRAGGKTRIIYQGSTYGSRLAPWLSFFVDTGSLQQYVPFTRYIYTRDCCTFYTAVVAVPRAGKAALFCTSTIETKIKLFVAELTLALTFHNGGQHFQPTGMEGGGGGGARGGGQARPVRGQRLVPP